MKLVYPAEFYPDKDGGYTVIIPDLPGCVTEGDSLEKAIEMGVDAASGWILGELEAGRPVPAASSPERIRPEDGGCVGILLLDMDAYAERWGNKAVRKNLTIPAWLNAAAEAKNTNFSAVLQEALLEKLGIAQKPDAPGSSLPDAG